MKPMIRGAGALLILALALFPAPAASEPEPRLVIPVPRIEANDQFRWIFPVRVINPLEFGLYADSLTCRIEDLDQGETRADRTHRVPYVSMFVNLLSTISGADSGAFVYQGAAIAEHARITFNAYFHTSAGRRYALETTAEAFPGPISRLYRSEFLEVDGRRVEYVLFRSLSRKPLSPALLIVHGHGSHARALLARGWDLCQRGYTVMLVSQPGYGLSQGPADLMGPATLRALGAALDRLKRTPGVDSARVGAWGMSRGATAVMTLAERRPDVAAVVGQSGIYDLWATYRGTKLPGFPETIVNEAGRDSSAWRERSPMLGAGKLHVPALVLHGERDLNVPFDQALAFFAALKTGNATVESKFFPQGEHVLPSNDVQQTVYEFIDRLLKP